MQNVLEKKEFDYALSNKYMEGGKLMNLSNDNKRILKALGIIFIAVLLNYKLPHKPYSTIEYIIRPIKKGNTTIYLAGFIPLILIVIATNILAKVEKLKYRNTSLIFIAILVIITPIMRKGLDITRTVYHFLADDGLYSIELLNIRTSLGITDNNAKIDIKLDLKDYGKGDKVFKIRIYFPEELKEIIGEEYYESERVHSIYGNRKLRSIDEVIVFKLEEDNLKEKLLNDWKINGKFEYEFYNEEEAIRITDKDF